MSCIRRIPFADPWIGEEEAREVYKAIVSKYLRYGGYVEEFEKCVANYIGTKYAIAVSTGTAALHVALLALGIGPGDEVIIPSFTCAPPAIAVCLCGARPVFADIEPVTLNLDPKDVKKKITNRTKAIVPIHYAGHPAELDELLEIAEKYGIYLVEDAAEAMGAIYKGRRVGSIGHVAVLAFSPNKIITTGEGGIVLTNDQEIAERARIIRDYGQRGRFNYIMIGHNYHMTEFQAAIGVVQMKKIDEIIRRRRDNAKLYNEYLHELEERGLLKLPSEKPYVMHTYTFYYIRVNPRIRDRLRAFLESHGVETRVYFPPLHKQSVYSRFCSVNSLPITEQVADEILNLPMSPLLTHEQIQYVCELIKRFLVSSL